MSGSGQCFKAKPAALPCEVLIALMGMAAEPLQAGSVEPMFAGTSDTQCQIPVEG